MSGRRGQPASRRSKRTKSSLSGVGVAIAIILVLLLRAGWDNQRDRTAADARKSDSVQLDQPRNSELGSSELERRSAPESKPETESADDPTTDDSSADSDLRFGLLRPLGGDRYLSPAGLEYGPGGAEGHRLEHVRRHADDQPNRNGPHGVFDGGMRGALQTIDEAYRSAKSDRRTAARSAAERTVYTINLGRRIGFVGGREGKRRRNPDARRVRLVLEGHRVITAYPL